MRKFYYDCPIKAAYMSKNFGVKFLLPVVLCDNNCENGIDIIPSIDLTIKEMGRVSVHPESEAIFEPKYQDIGVVESIGGLEEGMFNGTKWIYRDRHLKDENAKIIMRDNKCFFAPEL